MENKNKYHLNNINFVYDERGEFVLPFIYNNEYTKIKTISLVREEVLPITEIADNRSNPYWRIKLETIRAIVNNYDLPDYMELNVAGFEDAMRFAYKEIGFIGGGLKLSAINLNMRNSEDLHEFVKNHAATPEQIGDFGGFLAYANKKKFEDLHKSDEEMVDERSF